MTNCKRCGKPLKCNSDVCMECYGENKGKQIIIHSNNICDYCVNDAFTKCNPCFNDADEIDYRGFKGKKLAEVEE
jgi:hypothetical protein